MRTPKKFVSIHNHTTFSPYDGLGYPEEHFKWCLENGLDAHAITEHGNFNSYAHAQLLVQDWKKSGKTFKYLPGIEAYFHPNLDDWRMEKLKSESDKLVEKERKKNKEKIKTELIITSDDNDDVVDIESKNALTIEDEDESKSTKHFNPLNRRHHLVLLPKNDQGLQELFYLTSKSFLEGYYRFPRMDVRMIKETITKGNVVASTACLHPDSLLVTNFGTLKIIDVINKLNSGQEVFTLSYDTNQNKVCFKKIVWGDCTRKNAKLLQIKLKNGKTIKLTSDHKVYTDKGWIEAQFLTKEHKILSV